MSDIYRQKVRSIVHGAYQTQKLRIATGNRIVNNFKVKLGQAPGTPEVNLDDDAKKILATLRKDYKIITDGVKNFPSIKSFKAQGIIDDYTELSLLEQYFNLEKVEENMFLRLKYILNDIPIWNKYLANVEGIGPALGGILISEIDIHKANYPTSLWRLAGLDVAWDNKGRSKRKEHLEQVEYIKRNGKKGIKNSITYKPLLKTKLTAILAPSFIKRGDKSPYSKMYYDYKHRLENHIDHKDCFVALDVQGCKDKLGTIPKKVYRKRYITEYYNLCEQHIIEKQPDLTPEALSSEVKKLIKDTLKSYEILETLEERGLLIGPFDSDEELKQIVASKNGVLRAPKEVEVILDEEEIDEYTNFIQTEEVFDDTPDSRGRVLYKCINIGKTKNHRNRMAYRYIAKRFLADLYAVWRELEGLPIAKEYHVEKLGIIHNEVSIGKIK